MDYVIKTKRLQLRKITDNDFDNLKAIISDEETMSYYPKPYDDNGVLRWINWCKDCYEKYGFGLWAIELKDNNTFIGDCGISKQNIDGQEVFEIGYHLNKHYWHQGYAIEAARAVKQYYFDNFDYDEIYSYMNSNNKPSYSLAIANGMSFVKEYDLDGEVHKVYRISRNEYELQRIYYVESKENNIYTLKLATFGFNDKENIANALNNIKYIGDDLIVSKYVKFKDEYINNNDDILYVEGKPVLLENSISIEDKEKYDDEFNLSIKAYMNNDSDGIKRWNDYLKFYEDKFLNFVLFDQR